MSQSESSRKHYQKNRIKRRLEIKKRMQSVLKFVQDYKTSHPCVRCSESVSCCLDFHHENPEQKIDHISTLARKGWSINRVQTEIDKCIVLCANCHRKEHHGAVV